MPYAQLVSRAMPRGQSNHAHHAYVDMLTPPILKVIFEEKVPVVTYVGDLFDEINTNAKYLLLFRTIPAYCSTRRMNSWLRSACAFW